MIEYKTNLQDIDKIEIRRMSPFGDSITLTDSKDNSFTFAERNPSELEGFRLWFGFLSDEKKQEFYKTGYAIQEC